MPDGPATPKTSSYGLVRNFLEVRAHTQNKVIGLMSVAQTWSSWKDFKAAY
jgi:hypothetical protein